MALRLFLMDLFAALNPDVLKKDFTYLFLERREGREKEKERSIKHGCLSRTPY